MSGNAVSARLQQMEGALYLIHTHFALWKQLLRYVQHNYIWDLGMHIGIMHEKYKPIFNLGS